MSALCPGTDRSEEAPGVRWTLGAILRTFLPHLLQSLKLGAHQLRVLSHLAACGTGELGANLLSCPHCKHHHWAPRSCGDRHCPSCLAGKSRQWLQKQLQSLLPVTYYHCVFTLPPELHALALAYPCALYKLLFDSAAQSLLAFGRQRMAGDIGLSAVLHTWGQQLNFHPHLHCIVTGGALSADAQRWRSLRTRKFLFDVHALGVLFRGKFLAGLRDLWERGEITLLDPALPCPWERRRWFSKLYARSWVVYAKRPFGGPKQVLRYLANYTHRVALSNRRITGLDEQQQSVTFTYRDYRDGSQVKSLTLSAQEFIRRFSLHILPPGLVRIRHYGILANNRRQRDIAIIRKLLERASPTPAAADKELSAVLQEPMRCPACGQLGLRLVAFTDRHGILHMASRSAGPDFEDST